MRPLIGITPSRHKFALKLPGPVPLGAVLSDDYAQAVEAAGGIPVILPYLESEEALLATLSKLDGLLFSGGDDVSPLAYDEEPRLGLGSVTPERDFMELTLLHHAIRARTPIFGICRGIQVINVGLGGSLYQDLPREWRGVIQHSQQSPRNHLTHTVHLDPDSRIRSFLDQQTTLRTNSFHHQAIRSLAPGLEAVAWDDEGLIEAVEHTTQPFLIAVQWHPENLWRTAPAFLGLFRGFVEAAARKSVV